jgi:hypothetical protein
MFRFTDRLSPVSQQIIAGLVVLAIASVSAWFSPTFLRFIIRIAGTIGEAARWVIFWVIAHRAGIGLLILGALIVTPFIWGPAFRRGHAAAVREAELANEAAARLQVLSEAEIGVIRMLVEADGSPIFIHELQTHFGWSFFQTRITLRELAARGYTEAVTDMLFTTLGGQVRIRLTGLGIDYAVRSGLISVS